ncbi:Uncharacterised protein [uncultured archaeon]|nr:Uncharacterised protein [uncultured archaeon]
MAPKPALLLALLLLPALFAAQTPLQKFLNSSFEPDQSVSAQPLASPGQYYLVSAGGLEAYVVDGSSGSAVLDRARLVEILSDDSRSKSGLDAKASAALGLDEEIASAKDAGEKKCMQYLGLDMHPCSDRESCIRSCFSVPQCSAGPLYSDGFLEAFMEWNAGRQRFDSLLMSYSDSQEKMLEDASLIDQKAALLSELSALSANLSKNAIFLNRSDEGCGGGGTVRCYEYCPKVNYSASRIDAGRQNLASLKSALASLQSQPVRAEGILNRSLQNDNYLSSRGRLYEEFRLGMQKKVRDLNLSAESLSRRVWDREVDLLISSLSNYSAGVAADAAAGLYRKALAAKPAFESRAKAISDRISSDQSRAGLLDAKLSSLEKKIANGEWVLGNLSSEKYLGQLLQIRENAAAPATIAEIAAADGMADALKAEVDAEIASKATAQGSGKPVQLPIQLPQGQGAACPFAFALLALLAAAFARR